MSFPIPANLREILIGHPALRHSYLVGGCVRDWLLDRTVNDYDIEVYGVTYEQLESALSSSGRTDLVGRSFGVVKLTTPEGDTHDFGIPRRDSKVAPGHKGFSVHFDPGIAPEEAAARRDFTVNAMMYDPRREEVLDFFGGRDDLEKRVLRHTSPAFAEDPLRVLRGMQFVSRLNLRPAPETIDLCRSMESRFRELAIERVREEWFKWASTSVRPSAGIEFLRVTGWINHFPEIAALIGTPQDPEWHPEGDVFVHTCHCLDAMVELPAWKAADDESRIVYMLAALAHDFGKPATTQLVERDGRERIVSPGHEEAGEPIAEEFLRRINAPQAIADRVAPLVRLHLAHLSTPTDRSIRRLARRLQPESIQGLCLVMSADHAGRPPKSRETPESVRELLRRAEELAVQQEPPPPVLLGRHLQQIGLKPGRDFGVILHAAYEAQLEGLFSDTRSGWRWLAGQLELPIPAEARERAAAMGL